MLTFRAKHRSSDQQMTWQISAGQTLSLGRSDSNDCAIPWDRRVSRKHARVSATVNHLIVECLPDASNLIWQDGHSLTKVELASGESFQIGQTNFELREASELGTILEFVEAPASASTGSSMMLSDADVRLSLVSRNAPTLWSAPDEATLASKAIMMLR